MMSLSGFRGPKRLMYSGTPSKIEAVAENTALDDAWSMAALRTSISSWVLVATKASRQAPPARQVLSGVPSARAGVALVSSMSLPDPAWAITLTRPGLTAEVKATIRVSAWWTKSPVFR